MLKNINALVLRVHTYNIYRARCARWGGNINYHQLVVNYFVNYFVNSSNCNLSV